MMHLVLVVAEGTAGVMMKDRVENLGDVPPLLWKNWDLTRAVLRDIKHGWLYVCSILDR